MDVTTAHTRSAAAGTLAVLLLLAALAAAAGAALAQLVGLDPEAVALPTLGAVTLAESAKLTTDQFKAGIIETFILESVVLDVIPFLEIEGNAYKYNEEATLPGVEFRAVNASYTESTGTVNPRTEGLVILGGDADVDRFIEQTRGNLQSQREVQERLKVKATVYKWQDAFINGDTAVDANSFDGLKKRLTGARVVDAGTNGIPVVGTTSAERQDFFDKVDELIEAAGLQPGEGALYMNSLVRAKFKSSARREGAWSQDVDDFGRTIDAYNGIPFRNIGKKADGSLIIPQTETQGSSNVASSIYAVRFGEDEADGGVTGLTNGGIMVDDLGQLETKPVYRTRIETYTGLAVFGGAARLRGVLNS